MSSDRKVALVTGAAQGIGLGIARALVADGFNAVACDIQDESDAAGALDTLREAGADVLYCRADVADAAARTEMIDRSREHFGRLDLLVNNAGIAPKVRADMLEASEESYELVMKVNLQGPYFLTQAVANWMIEQSRERTDFDGCIVNISSISATVASTARGEYCISKAGVSMATRLWAARLGEFDIPVYEIQPGLIKTDMTAPVREKYDKLIAEGLLVQSRWGLPADIGKAVAMLARGDVAYSTGQVITIDGGLTLPRL